MNDFYDRYKINTDAELPLSLYDSVVRTLYANLLTMVIGMISMSIAPIILFAKTQDVNQLFFAAVFLVVGGIRFLIAVLFQTKSETKFTRQQLSQWENWYSFGGTLFVATGGIWVFYCFSSTNDALVQLMALSLLLCYMVGIIGRNFSSKKVVWQQVLAAGVMIIAALAHYGSLYHSIFAFFLFPFFIALWRMSVHLRSILFGAVVSEREQRIVAARFNVALKNISNGVAMFDTRGKILVANQQFATIVDVEDEKFLIGKNLSVLLDENLGDHTDFRSNVVDALKVSLKNNESNRFCFKKETRTFEVDLNPMPRGGVVFIRDITEQIETEAEIRKLASFDPLTNLPNRRTFTQNMEKLVSVSGDLLPLSIYFIDLDKFKEVNDSLGHAIGDQMLVEVATRLLELLPEEALICRFGGDEFVVVMPGLTDESECSVFAEKIIAKISKPMTVENKELRTGATVGISLCPQNGENVDILLKTSDAALYAAKSVVRGSHSFYTNSLGNSINERRQLETDLKSALEKEELELHYQPLVNVHSRSISTCEALLRWNHKEKGAIPPGIFVPIAEETGLINRLSEYVLNRACETCAKWPESVHIAVNISSLQFQQSDVFNCVVDALDRSGLNPTRLEIEVTESAMLANIVETTRTLNKIKALGVKISLDDFGTGFSSLSYLHTLPLDKVKIDRSFITSVLDDKKSLTLLKGITELTHNLGLKIVVEGIENKRQMVLLTEKVRVDEMQGYLFGKAMPHEDILTLLEEGRPMDLEKSHLKTVA